MQINKSATYFTFPVRVYWEDTDAGGIVFYANYLKFFERARTEWLRSLGLHQHALKEQHGGMFVVTEACMRYLLSARLDDMLCITARMGHAGKVQCQLHQQAWLLPPTPSGGTSGGPQASAHAGQLDPRADALPGVAPGARLLCEGDVHIAWVDAQHLRPRRLPPAVLQALQAAS